MGILNAYYAYTEASGLAIQMLAALCFEATDMEKLNSEDLRKRSDWPVDMRASIEELRGDFMGLLEDFPLTDSVDACLSVLETQFTSSALKVLSDFDWSLVPLIQPEVPDSEIIYRRCEYLAAKQLIKMILSGVLVDKTRLVPAILQKLGLCNSHAGYLLCGLVYGTDLMEAFAAADRYVQTQTNLPKHLSAEETLLGYQQYMGEKYTKHSIDYVWVTWAHVALIECNMLALMRNSS